MLPMADYDVRLKSNGDYWQAWWVDPATKRRRVQSIGAKSKYSRRSARAECRNLETKLRQTAGRVRSGDGGAPRLSEWIETVAREVAVLRKGTQVMYRITGNYLLRHFDADPRIDRITPDAAAGWRVALRAGELNLDNAVACDPPGEATACRHTKTAKAMFRRAMDRNLITANPFAKLRSTEPAPDGDWYQVTPADLARILDACPNNGYRALFALARFAGLRRDEARVALAWRDVLWDRNRLVVNARVTGATTKGRRRVCPIEVAGHPTGLTDLLRLWYEQAPAGSHGPCDGVFASHRLYEKVARVLADAGLAFDDPFHTCRKCWETELADRFPLHVVVSWLGNSIRVAQRHYLRVDEAYYGGNTPRPARQIVVFRDGRYQAICAPIVPDAPVNGMNPGGTPTVPESA
jgi:integrase